MPDDKVDDHELQNVLAHSLRGWSKSGNALERTFELPGFKAALEFVNAVGGRAEEMGHHPDIDVRYNKVTLSLTSHDAGGITRRDLRLAEYAGKIAPAHRIRKTA
jgi:4a-hydroxytetrahydrobiopterin dehydratase